MDPTLKIQKFIENKTESLYNIGGESEIYLLNDINLEINEKPFKNLILKKIINKKIKKKDKE